MEYNEFEIIGPANWYPVMLSLKSLNKHKQTKK